MSGIQNIFMFAKYSLGFSNSCKIDLTRWILFFSQFFYAMATCSRPHFPAGGSYNPSFSEYAEGTEIAYSCDEPLRMFGVDRVICQPNGKWSGKTPFCDKKVEIQTKRLRPRYPLNVLSRLIDHDTNTCFKTHKSESVGVYLDPHVTVYAVMIFLPEGRSRYKITLFESGSNIHEHCDTYEDSVSEQGLWFPFICQNKEVKTQFIRVESLLQSDSAITLCEIEVYAKSDEWCENPPENGDPNGQLEVSRREAVLHCNTGFKKNADLRVYSICKHNEWSKTKTRLSCINDGKANFTIFGTKSQNAIVCHPFISKISNTEGIWRSNGVWNESNLGELSVGRKLSLHCKPGYHPKGKPLTVTCHSDGKWTRTSAICKKKKRRKSSKITAIAIGTVSVLLIFIVLSFIFFAKRKKVTETTVKCESALNNRYSTLPSIGDRSTRGLSEAEYSNIDYEAIDNYQNNLRSISLKTPTLETQYSKPVDNRILYKQAPIYQLPVDLAPGTVIKTNSLYNPME